MDDTRHIWRRQPIHLQPEPANCPDPFASYLINGTSAGESSSSSLTILKKHMAYLGWTMESRFCGNVTRRRYISPEGKCYYSLFQVCRRQCGCTESPPALIYEDDCASAAAIEMPALARSSESNVRGDIDCDRAPASCAQAIIEYHMLGAEECQSGAVKDLRRRVKEELLAIGWYVTYQQREGRRDIVYYSPRGGHYFSLRRACKRCIKDLEIQRKSSGNEGGVNAGEVINEAKFSRRKSIMFEKALQHPKKTRKVLPHRSHLRALGKQKHVRDRQSQPTARAVRLGKNIHDTAPKNLSQNPMTVLSWLIDNDVLFPRTNVYCHGDGSSYTSLMKGRVQREGIKCGCCSQVFTLRGFVSHSGGSGGTFGTPAARIFLEDGRSLLDCQIQIMKKITYLREDAVVHKNYVEWIYDNDHVCSICNYGGEIILCDRCPSSFHGTCLGLKGVPDGDWFCPSCCCGFCGDGNLRKEIGPSQELVTCYQCGLKYHTACLIKKRADEHTDNHRVIWYCSNICEQIHEGLLELEGKQIDVGRDELTLTFIKADNFRRHDDADLVVGSAAENYVKLNMALGIMHECFEPFLDPRSGRDQVEDIIFNRELELNRLNFRGFYTLLLEKNDELVTVAIIKIHGENVAEIPIIGTRFKFRQLGMCHALMGTLEKKLKELGVMRMALPSSPIMLGTWTGSFGFKEMTELERLRLVNYALLNFQDTIMCQKQLLDAPSKESTMSENFLLTFADHSIRSPDTALEADADGSRTSVQEHPKVYEPSQLQVEQSFTKSFSKGLVMAADSDGKLDTLITVGHLLGSCSSVMLLKVGIELNCTQSCHIPFQTLYYEIETA
ncbi:hypothetical protein SAY87_006209 [Trapa incisa]|uniref:PHD-type domain-containing protein n=1 Tax=Trapa incisa TaxID=236973 RepID=A0AAN7KC07_9MYRT|nr:hypothetical protein SAY87_006209 [Trapa incisa]